MRLLLTRHGQTANNVAARYTGQADIPLSLMGERQAQALGMALANERFDAIISSDLLRAMATAREVARFHPQLDIQQMPGLREIAMGAWEGHTHAEVAAEDPDLMERWQRDPVTHAPLGGETVAELRDRLAAALEQTRAAYPEGTVLWVTHGGCIGVLLCNLLGMDLARRWQFRRDNAAITEIEIGPDWAVITRLNETTHLRALEQGEAVEQRQVL